MSSEVPGRPDSVVCSVVGRLALILLFLQAAAAPTFVYVSAATVVQGSSNQSPAAPGSVPLAPANASPQAPANVSPAEPVPPVDPAAAIFAKTSTAGLILVTVHADKVGDYEEVIRALQKGLAESADARQQAIAKGWRVFKSATDPKANAIYIHLIDPIVPQTDYRPSLLLDEILAGASAEMLAKYRDAIVGAPSMLSMNEFARMSVAPPAPSTNASPAGPQTKKPGT